MMIEIPIRTYYYGDKGFEKISRVLKTCELAGFKRDPYRHAITKYLNITLTKQQLQQVNF